MLNFEKLSLIVIARLLSKLGGSVRTIPLTGDERDVIIMADEYIAMNAEREQLESAAKMLRDAGWDVSPPVRIADNAVLYTVRERRDMESRASADRIKKAIDSYSATPITEPTGHGAEVWTQDFMRHFINSNLKG